MEVLCLVLVLLFRTLCPSSSAIVLVGTRELAAFLVSCDSQCLWLFLVVPWVVLRCVIVVFPYHTHLRFWSSEDKLQRAVPM